MSNRRAYLDVTTVTDRNEVASAFGECTAWQAAITQLRKREAEATNPQRKRYLRLMLLNAETQLALLK